MADRQAQEVAAEFGVTQTAFVVPSDSAHHTCRVRILAGDRELPFSYRAILGAAAVLGANLRRVPNLRPGPPRDA
ncbi:PhzF family phenazine biosynthesis protein [Nocardia gipuzkoensis]